MSTTFKLDTGAKTNVLPHAVYKSLKRKVRCEKHMNLHLKLTKTVLVAYSGEKLKPEGRVLLECSTAHSKANLLFYVSKHSETAILGNQKDGHWYTHDQIPHYKRGAAEATSLCFFYGLWQFSGESHIDTDPAVTPVIQGCRKISLAVMETLRDTLDDLLKTDVREPVTEPTTWVNILVMTEKIHK